MGLVDKTTNNKAVKPNKALPYFEGATLSIGGKVVGTVKDVSVTTPSKVASIQVAEVSQEDALTTEFIHVKAKYDSFDGPKLAKRIEELKKQLQSIANEQIAEDSVATFSVPEGEVTFSARKQCREIIDPAGLLEKLIGLVGFQGAAKLVSINLSSIDQVFQPHEVAQFIKTEYGSRTLQSVKENLSKE